jgi:hypothetical protein
VLGSLARFGRLRCSGRNSIATAIPLRHLTGLSSRMVEETVIPPPRKSILDVLFGRPLSSEEDTQEQIRAFTGVPVFGLDAHDCGRLRRLLLGMHVLGLRIDGEAGNHALATCACFDPRR